MKSRFARFAGVAVAFGLSLAAGNAATLNGAVFLETGTISSSSHNGAGGYDQASSIVPATDDIAIGSATFSTNYLPTNEANNPTNGTASPAVLVDGQTATAPSNFGNASLNPSQATNSNNAAFDLGPGNIGAHWYVSFQLPTSSTGNGWDITSTQVISGHQDTRASQAYDLLVSADGVTYYSLSDGSANGIGSTTGPGYSFGAASGAAQTTVSGSTNVGDVMATGVKYLEFVEMSDGSDVYREVAAYGIATAAPEPATVSLASLGALGLLARRRRDRLR